MGAHNASINTPQLLVDGAYIDMGGAKAMEDLVQCAVGIPTVITTINRLPRTEVAGQITPRRARSEYPENSIHDHSAVLWRPAGFCAWRKHVFNACPLVIRESISSHP